jgi:MFS family permease
MQTNLISDVSFLRLWVSNTASGLATWALPFVLGLAIISGDLDAAHAGLALAARTLGFVAAMPVGGVLADRSGPRRMIFGAGLLAAFGIIPIVAGLAGFGGLAAILIGAGIAGFGQGACRASYQAIIPRVVSEENRQPANAAMTISIRVSTLVGPTLATASVLAIGSSPTLFIISALWIAAALLPTWPPRQPKTEQSSLTATSFVAELGEGFAEAYRHPWFIAGLAALTLVIAFGYSVTNVLLPQISEAQYGGPQLMATSVTAYTIGAFAGALIISRWKPKDIGWLALVGLALYGFVPLSLLFSNIFFLPIIAFFLAGIGIEFFNVPWFTAAQREIPQDRLARVTSVDFLFSYGLAPLGLAGLTPLTQLVGTDTVLWLCAIICIGAPLLAMLVRGSRGFANVG